MLAIPRDVKARCLRKWHDAYLLIGFERDWANPPDQIASDYRDWWDEKGAHRCALCHHMEERGEEWNPCRECPLNSGQVCHPAWDDINGVMLNNDIPDEQVIDVFEENVMNMLAALHDLPTLPKEVPCSR